MALPTLVKTWEFDVNNRGGVGLSIASDIKKHAFAIKEALISASFTLPMVVTRSSNASVADGTDNWATYADVVVSSGNHSWIVLKSQGTVPYEICIAFDDNTSYQSSFFGFSMTGGFNAGAGGTDGTISARPTATDEVAVHTTNWNWAGGQFAAFSSMIHVLMSTDANTMMMIVYINGAAVSVIRADIIQNPTTGYAIGGGAGMHFWLRFTNDATNVLAFSQAAGSGNKWSLDDVVGLDGNVFFSYEAIDVTEIACIATFHQPNAWTGKWPFYPVGVWTTGAKRGRVGTLSDIWWSSGANAQGDMYPAVGSLYQFANVGNMIIPWDGVGPLLKA